MINAIVINDTTTENHHGCDVVMRGIYELCNRNYIEVKNIIFVGMPKDESNKIIDEENYDICIVNGEGTLHHSQPRATFIAELINRVSSKQRKIFVINSTVEDNDDYILGALRKVDGVFVREPASQEYLRENNISSEVVPDMSFFTEYVVSREKRNNSFALSDSVYSEVSNKLFDISTDNNMTFAPALRRPIINVTTIYNFLRYIKHWLRLILSYISFLPLSYEIKRIRYLDDKYESYIDKIYDASGVVVARFHTMCFALKTQTPFVAVSSNTHKMQSLLKEIGVSEDRVIPVESVDDKICEDIRPFSQDEINLIQNYTKNAKRKIEDMFSTIATISRD